MSSWCRHVSGESTVQETRWLWVPGLQQRCVSQSSRCFIPIAPPYLAQMLGSDCMRGTCTCTWKRDTWTLFMRTCMLGTYIFFRYLSERETADRNFALGYYMQENKARRVFFKISLPFEYVLLHNSSWRSYFCAVLHILKAPSYFMRVFSPISVLSRRRQARGDLGLLFSSAYGFYSHC